MPDKLGSYLKELRGKESLRDVSKRTNGKISHSYIADLEKGVSRRGNKISPSPETLKVLSKVYNTDYDKLMKLAGYSDKDYKKKHVDLADDDVVMSYEGKPIPPEDLEIIRRFFRGGKNDK
ncbi:helix-turn-helix domain-containing protein [Companilactobacillus zhachilii]|uniref:helix-turn-helix domain-containing protein n=1 Tax=Companilactobacillus zhachilii TaxID=2304606 RepID=UPI004034307D